MKQLFKSLFLIATMALMPLASQAQWSTNYSANLMTNNILRGNYHVSQITVLTDTNAATVNFYDSETNRNTFAYSTYTNYVMYATNAVSIYTNSVGTLITNTYKAIYSNPVSVSGSTRILPILTSISCPANSIITIDTDLITARGLTAVSTVTNTTLNIKYLPNLNQYSQ